MALAKGGIKPETLTAALASASTSDKSEIAELLKKAGAVPPPAVDAATLQSYAGKYRSEQGNEVVLSVKDGTLLATPTGQGPLAMMSIDKTSFRPVAFDGIVITLIIENEKVTGFNLKQSQGTSVFKRVN